MLTRRAFIKASGLAVFSISLGGLPTFLPRAALAATRPLGKKKVLVAIFQRGAMDGLMAVQPLNDPNLAKLRPGILIPTGLGPNGLLNLDDQIGRASCRE